MTLYDEKKAVEEIKVLPLIVRSHLSHVVRNGLALTHAAHELKGNVKKALSEFEKRWSELGL